MTALAAQAHVLRSMGAVLPMPMPIVFIVDRDISQRQSLEPLIECVGMSLECFGCARDFLDRPRPLVPSCLLLEVNLPDFSGLDLQMQIIAADRTEMPIIFITDCADVPVSVRAMKAGAVDYLTKPVSDDVLLRAVRRAIELSRASLEEAQEMRALRDRYQSLTPRQCEVMTLVVSGLLNKQIAADLGLSEITVKVHRGVVMRKMKARSLPGLVTMAAKLGLPRPCQ